MVKKSIAPAIFLAVFAACVGITASAQALTLEEMKSPGSSLVWRETDKDMRTMDVADYLFSKYAKSEVSEQRIANVESCLNTELKPYEKLQVGDNKAPSLSSLLKKCKA
jgi:hypothetical protein